MPTFIGFDNPDFDREGYMESTQPYIVFLERKIERLTTEINDLLDRNGHLQAEVDRLKTAMIGSLLLLPKGNAGKLLIEDTLGITGKTLRDCARDSS